MVQQELKEIKVKKNEQQKKVLEAIKGLENKREIVIRTFLAEVGGGPTTLLYDNSDTKYPLSLLKVVNLYENTGD